MNAHLALGFGGILQVKVSCTSLKRELFFRNTDLCISPWCVGSQPASTPATL